jgi:hypothetical protein
MEIVGHGWTGKPRMNTFKAWARQWYDNPGGIQTGVAWILLYIET